MKLRSKFLLSFFSLIVVVIGLAMVALDRRQTAALLHHTQQKGLAIARSLGAVSTNALLGYNYAALQYNVDQAAKEEDISYAIILDKEGRIAAYSGALHRQGEEISDQVGKTAFLAPKSIIQYHHFRDASGSSARLLDVAVPVYVEGSTAKWGTVRIGLSLAGMYEDLRRTRLTLLFIGLMAILLGWFGAVVLSRVVTGPVVQLTAATRKAARGDLDQRLEVKTSDELGVLAQSFNEMIRDIKLSREEIQQLNLELEKKVEQRTRELKEAKEYLENIINNSQVAITMVDMEGNFIIFNKGAELLTGYRADEVIGKKKAVEFYENPEDANYIAKIVLKKGFLESFESTLKKNDGSRVVMSITASLLRDVEGKPIGSLGITVDRTEQRRLEQKQREMQLELLQESKLAAIGTMVAGIAHNLNSPLTVIRGRAEMLLRENLGKKVNGVMTKIVNQANRMSDIIVNMMYKSRQEQAKEAQWININDLLQEELTFLDGDMYFKHNVDKEYHFDDSIKPIRAVYSDFSQSILNILRNSIDAMHDTEERTLTITTYQDDDFICIDFHDTGVGIPPEHISRLFDPFFTTKPLSVTGNGKPTGTGLGLSSAYMLLKPYGGKIEVKSKPGDTTFTLKIPKQKE